MGGDAFSTQEHGGSDFPRVTFRRVATVVIALLLIDMALSITDVLGIDGLLHLNRGAELIATFAALGAWMWSVRRSTGAERAWRSVMATATALFTLGLVTWLWTEFFPQTGLLVRIVTAVCFLITPLVILAATTVHVRQPASRPRSRRTPRRWRVPLLDLLIIGCSALLFSMITLGDHIGDAIRTPNFVRLVIVLNPLVYLLVGTVIVILARLRRSARDLPVLFIGVGAVAYAASATGYVHMAALRQPTSQPWLEAWFLACPVCFFLAALAPTTPERRVERAGVSPRELALLALPYFPLMLTVLFVTGGLAGDIHMTVGQELTFLVLVVLVLIRHLLTLADNRLLLHRAEFAAAHDPLTMVANRTLFMERLERLLEQRTESLVLVFCDMDDFKEVNDTFGHLAGDRVLVDTAARLRSCVRDTDIVARLGGDEFALIVHDPPADLANRILAELQRPHRIDGDERVVSASIGVTKLFPHIPIADTDELLHWVDTAMYTAKRNGKNTFAQVP